MVWEVKETGGIPCTCPSCRPLGMRALNPGSCGKMGHGHCRCAAFRDWENLGLTAGRCGASAAARSWSVLATPSWGARTGMASPDRALRIQSRVGSTSGPAIHPEGGQE